MTAAHPRLEMLEGAAVPEEGALAVGGTTERYRKGDAAAPSPHISLHPALE